MQPISIKTTSERFIVFIDKRWVDGEAFARFIEQLKLKIMSKDINFSETLDQLMSKESHQTPRYVAAQKFKSSAKSAYSSSKYNVYEQ